MRRDDHNENVLSNRRKAELLALDLRSGRVLWRQAIGGGSPVLGGPVFTGERVYALAADETLTILDADRGRIIEQHRLGAPETPAANDMCASGPLLVKGRLYVATQTGGLRCFGGKVPQAKSAVGLSSWASRSGRTQVLLPTASPLRFRRPQTTPK